MKKTIAIMIILALCLISCKTDPFVPFDKEYDESLPKLAAPSVTVEFYNGSTSTDSSDWSLWDLDIENVANFPEGTSFMAEWESGNRHGTADIDEVPMLLYTDYFKKGDFTIKVRVIAQCEGWNYSDATVVAER